MGLQATASSPDPIYRVEVRDNERVPVDATLSLSARLWLPQSPTDASQPQQRFAVVLEYLPYRWSDWTAPRDARNHLWLAQRGIAVARVDVRGSGNSLGACDGEYTSAELDDGERVIAWLAAQPWSSGRVGVFGKSWGGFNGLQLAARAPPALAGVVSLYSIDDRYADDVHYMGGAVLGSEALSWATVMLLWNARPPAPEAIGDAPTWQAAWRERLSCHHSPWLHDWLAHQARDAFWEHGSISEAYSSVHCPVLLIGGWADGYHNGVQRMLTSLTGTSVRKGVVGPWSHDWPHVAHPGPQVGFLELCRQWWDFTLHNVADSPVPHFPDLQLYVKHALSDAALSPQVPEQPGRWLSVPDARDVQQQFVSLHLTPHGVLTSDRTDSDRNDSDTTDSQAVVVRTQNLQGAWSGEWLSFGGPDMPGDQAAEDALATTWTTAPLDSDGLEVVGYPLVSVALMSSHAQALVVARLCDVSPSGKSALISRGVLNLSHRHGHAPDALEAMPVGAVVDVSFALNYCAYRVPAGHRVRLALTPHYWPLVWPSPEPTELTVVFASQHNANVVRLPILSDGVASNAPCPVTQYPLDRGCATRAITLREPVPLRRTLAVVLSEVDASSAEQQQLTTTEDEGVTLLINEGITLAETCEKRYSLDPNGRHPRVDIVRSLTYEQLDAETHERLLREHAAAVVAATDAVEDARVTRTSLAEHATIPYQTTITTTSAMWSNATTFFVDDHLIVHLDGTLFFEKTWTKQIKRHFV